MTNEHHIYAGTTKLELFINEIHNYSYIYYVQNDQDTLSYPYRPYLSRNCNKIHQKFKTSGNITLEISNHFFTVKYTENTQNIYAVV